MNDQISNSQLKSRDQSLGFFSLLKEILWSFLGVRSAQGYEKTFSRARPRDLILVGLFATLLFILILIFVAHFAISLATS